MGYDFTLIGQGKYHEKGGTGLSKCLKEECSSTKKQTMQNHLRSEHAWHVSGTTEKPVWLQ